MPPKPARPGVRGVRAEAATAAEPGVSAPPPPPPPPAAFSRGLPSGEAVRSSDSSFLSVAFRFALAAFFFILARYLTLENVERTFELESSESMRRLWMTCTRCLNSARLRCPRESWASSRAFSRSRTPPSSKDECALQRFRQASFRSVAPLSACVAESVRAPSVPRESCARPFSSAPRSAKRSRPAQAPSMTPRRWTPHSRSSESDPSFRSSAVAAAGAGGPGAGPSGLLPGDAWGCAGPGQVRGRAVSPPPRRPGPAAGPPLDRHAPPRCGQRQTW